MISIPLFDFFLHIRKGPSPIRAGSLAEAVEEAARIVQLEPFQITDGRGSVLLDEDRLKTEIAQRGGRQ
jgi:hypothetical protein